MMGGGGGGHNLHIYMYNLIKSRKCISVVYVGFTFLSSGTLM